MKTLFNRILVLSLISTNLLAASFNVRDRIESQKVYLDIYPSVFGKKEVAHKESFFKSINKLKGEAKTNALFQLSDIDRYFPAKITQPLVYWHSIEKNKNNLEDTIFYYMVYKLFILRDHIDNPLSSPESVQKAKDTLKSLLDESAHSNNISNYFESLRESAKELANKPTLKNLLDDPIISTTLKNEVSDIDSYSLSALGLVPSNKTEIVSKNDRSLERIDWFNERVIFAGGELDFDAPYVKMPTKDDWTGNIVFKEDPIYQRIREMIDRAEHSVFIDIFLFGGTLGATLSEYLLDETIKKLKKNPDFKVLILHDYATNYNMVAEMVPIFEYIKKRSETEKELKDHVFLLQANIQRHPPGIPFYVTEIIPKTSESFKYFEAGNTYYESKIDHSKVIVVDGNHDDAEAYFGSKNWTDHSGGYYYDDAIYVTGPAAGLVQASYYRDIDAALTTDETELSRMYYKEKGLDNKHYLDQREDILKAFEVTKDSYKVNKPTKVRIAEADVDGTIKNVRNMIVDMIVKAKSHIYMEQLFLYDPYIVDALLRKKAKEPNVDIRLVLDHNGNFGMNGLPNTIFVKEMVDSGIKVRARKTYGITANFPDGTKQDYHQENHRKISSIDGKVVLGGSSNINPDTLQGSFREFGAQIYDKSQVKLFEDRFKKDWDDSEKMVSLDIEHFEAVVLGKQLDKKESNLLNAILSKILRAKDFLEERF